jgi:hypothetical protein
MTGKRIVGKGMYGTKILAVTPESMRVRLVGQRLVLDAA